ncbi:condensin complex subunit 1 [Babesia microti strain RI]|uniref:Condensin complex subunit 1 n=1 Tax=Babesia microti (strain RI) TaxID=1133968 RepID=I7J7X9_BABMR|nr:condensin complex subunit 1 [Babesia microti strain RI]CCF72524.1 condensin complex subunit 1 [Babesia microti strain RI]|eukprot:XP_012647133.1 condensin complex subunit 1 [Babesia microti strain RI]
MALINFAIPPTLELDYLLRPSDNLNASDAPDATCWSGPDFDISIGEVRLMVNGTINEILNLLTNDGFCHWFNLARAFGNASAEQQDCIAHLFTQACKHVSILTIETGKWIDDNCQNVSKYPSIEALNSRILYTDNKYTTGGASGPDGLASLIDIGKTVRSIVEAVTMLTCATLKAKKPGEDEQVKVTKARKGNVTKKDKILGLDSIAKGLVELAKGTLMAGYHVKLGGSGHLSENFARLLISGLLQCNTKGILMGGLIPGAIKSVIDQCITGTRLPTNEEEDSVSHLDWVSLIIEEMKKPEGVNLVAMFADSKIEECQVTNETEQVEKESETVGSDAVEAGSSDKEWSNEHGNQIKRTDNSIKVTTGTSGQIVADLLIATRENAALQAAALNTASVQAEFGNIGAFFEKLAKASPVNLLININAMKDLFDVPCYNLRKSVGDVITTLLQIKTNDSTPPAFRRLISRTRDELFQTLACRVFDSYMYGRVHILRGIQEIVENEALPLNYYTKVAQIALKRLMDRGSMVRQRAMSLIAVLLADVKENKLDMSTVNDLLSSEMAVVSLDEEVPQLNMESDESLTVSLKAYSVYLVRASLSAAVEYLKSTTESDQKAAIRFLGTVHLLGFRMASDLIPKAWELVWTNNQNVHDVVTAEFSRIYFSNTPEGAAISLLKLVAVSNNSCAASLDLLFRSALARSDLPVAEMIDGVVNVLLNIATAGVAHNKTAQHARESLGLCRIIFSSAAMLKGTASEYNFKLDAHRCATLRRMLIDHLRRPDPDYVIFNELCLMIRYCCGEGVVALCYTALELILEKFGTPDRYFYPCVQAVIDLVFTHYDHPEDVCSDIIKIMIGKMVTSTGAITCSMVSHLLFISGHVALCTIVALEGLLSKLKHARTQQEQKADDKEGMGTASKGECELDEIEKLIENGVTSTNLIGGNLKKLLFAVIKCQGLDETLRSCAIVVLSKLAVISKSMCTECIGNKDVVSHLLDVLLDNKANTDNKTLIRKTLLVCYGDLLCRFPNLMEPFNRRVFFLLRDRNDVVRETATMVFTHLIMNDMIKPKGKLLEYMSFLTLDRTYSVSACAKMFFIEIHKKNPNVIYNIFPEMAAILAMNRRNMSLAVNATILRMFISFVNKDKQQIVLVGKICERLAQCKDAGMYLFSFVLVELCKEPKCIGKLGTMIPVLRHVLAADESVRAAFWAIVNRAKSFRGLGLQEKAAAEGSGTEASGATSTPEASVRESLKDLTTLLLTLDEEPLSYEEPPIVHVLAEEEYDQMFLSDLEEGEEEEAVKVKFEQENGCKVKKEKRDDTYVVRIKRELST